MQQISEHNEEADSQIQGKKKKKRKASGYHGGWGDNIGAVE